MCWFILSALIVIKTRYLCHGLISSWLKTSCFWLFTSFVEWKWLDDKTGFSRRECIILTVMGTTNLLFLQVQRMGAEPEKGRPAQAPACHTVQTTICHLQWTLWSESVPADSDRLVWNPNTFQCSKPPAENMNKTKGEPDGFSLGMCEMLQKWLGMTTLSCPSHSCDLQGKVVHLFTNENKSCLMCSVS